MGNVAIGVGRRRRRWPEVEERLTQPRRLLRQLSDVDSGRLRRLIRSGDLAPCFDAAEDDAGLDEDCPICFYFYPSLNRSKCCGKGICTAVLSAKPHPTQLSIEAIEPKGRRNWINKRNRTPVSLRRKYSLSLRLLMNLFNLSSCKTYF
uniref:Uncharacterized protein n=2 Tax=Oryza nivara TaxID=4536 RepID=A0A0E0HUD1_ORYNI